METRLVLFSFMDILIRVPSLFLLDEVFQSKIAYLGLYPCTLLPLHKESDFDDVTGESYHTLLYDAHHSLVNIYNSSMFKKFNQDAILNVIEFNISTILSSSLDAGLEVYSGICGFILQIIVLFTASCVSIFALTLWTQHLLKIYAFLLCISVVVLSQYLNLKVFNSVSSAVSITSIFGAILNLDGTAFSNLLTILTDVIGNFVIQTFLTIVFILCQHHPISNWLQGILGLCFLLPSLTTVLPFDSGTVIQWCYYLLTAHCISVVVMNYNLVYKEVNGRIAHIIWGIRNDGILVFFESEWLRLNIPIIFRSFWLMRCGIHIYTYLASSDSSSWTDVESLNTLMKIVLVRGCETLLSLLGMASVFSWICAKLYLSSQAFMQIPHEGSTHIGPLAATLFVIFSFQYGLSTLKPASRIVRLMRILVLIITCFLHFTYTSVDTVLMSLAASANLDFTRHVRALLVSGLLTFALLSGLYVLWTTHSISTWLLAVSGFSVEALCKIAISLALYILFLLDARHQELWDKLDDHVYRIKFFGRIVEYMIGLAMMINSGIALILESGGVCRATLFGLQGYFNLSFFWDEALTGWKVYQKRRIAVRKIATLETAEDLTKIDDVCAICFNNLKPNHRNNVLIKVTPCRHYYHAVCLRKWLYVQDRCPMCHRTLWPELRTSHEDSDPLENLSLDEY